MAAGMADGLRKPQARPEGGVSICSWARRVGFSLLADPFPLRIGVRIKFLHCFTASGLCRPVCTTDSCCIVEKLCSDPAM